MNVELEQHLKQLDENRLSEENAKKERQEEEKQKRKEEREKKRLEDESKSKNYTLLAVSFAIVLLAYLLFNFARRV
jgi:cytoskeletal protein RodZ